MKAMKSPGMRFFLLCVFFCLIAGCSANQASQTQISDVVLDIDGNPDPGVEVYSFYFDGYGYHLEAKDTTDADGVFHLSGLKVDPDPMSRRLLLFHKPSVYLEKKLIEGDPQRYKKMVEQGDTNQYRSERYLLPDQSKLPALHISGKAPEGEYSLLSYQPQETGSMFPGSILESLGIAGQIHLVSSPAQIPGLPTGFIAYALSKDESEIVRLTYGHEEVTLEPFEATRVSGRLLDASGKPLPNAFMLGINGVHPSGSQEFRTDTQGAFEYITGRGFGGPAENFYLMWMDKDEVGISFTIPVTPGEDVTVGDLTLPEMVKITGKARLPDGTPVPGDAIFLSTDILAKAPEKDRSYMVGIKPDDNGVFTSRAPAGSLRITQGIRAGDTMEYVLLTESIEIPSDTRTLDVELKFLKPDFGNLKVVNKAGKPVTGAYIRCFYPVRSIPIIGYSAEKGLLRLPLIGEDADVIRYEAVLPDMPPRKGSFTPASLKAGEVVIKLPIDAENLTVDEFDFHVDRTKG